MLSSFSLLLDCWIINCRLTLDSSSYKTSAAWLTSLCCGQTEEWTVSRDCSCNLNNFSKRKKIVFMKKSSLNNFPTQDLFSRARPPRPRCIHSWIFKWEKAMQFIKLNYLIIHSWRTHSAFCSSFGNRSMVILINLDGEWRVDTFNQRRCLLLNKFYQRFLSLCKQLCLHAIAN